jgi:hypothetical protein
MPQITRVVKTKPQFVGDTSADITVIENRTPYIGEIVLFTPNPDDTVARSNHNNGEIPAIITRVWSDVCVNVKIIPDCGAMQDRTSVVHQSANPVGYHFRFQDEPHQQLQTTDGYPVSEENTADASTFLKQ